MPWKVIVKVYDFLCIIMYSTSWHAYIWLCMHMHVCMHKCMILSKFPLKNTYSCHIYCLFWPFKNIFMCFTIEQCSVGSSTPNSLPWKLSKSRLYPQESLRDTQEHSHRVFELPRPRKKRGFLVLLPCLLSRWIEGHQGAFVSIKPRLLLWFVLICFFFFHWQRCLRGKKTFQMGHLILFSYVLKKAE